MDISQKPMRATVFTLIVTTLLGCTASVIEGAKPKEVRVGTDTVALKLVTASVLRDDDEAGLSHVHLCFARTLLPNGPERSVSIALAPSYPFHNERPPYVPFREESGHLIMQVERSRVAEGCEIPRGKGLLERLPVIEADVDDRVALPENLKDAIVVSRRNPLALGYISATPVFGGYRSFAIDLTDSPLYAEYKDGRPYLLLLTPVTVVGDAILVTSLFFTAVTIGTVCPKSFASCR